MLPASAIVPLLRALLCVALSLLVAIPLRALQRKLRIARGLAPLRGPKGVFLLGNIPAFIKNKNRMYDFLEERLVEFGGIMKMPWHLFFDGAIYLEAEEGEGAAVLDIDTLWFILLSFLFAGKDTSSSVITYVFYALAQHPDVQQKLRDEVSRAESLEYESVKHMKYLDAVVSETMRLYPTVPNMIRYAVKDDHLPDGTFVPGNTQISIVQWYMGRHNPVFGEDREAFRPERWLEMEKRPTAYDFPIFSAGPRICLGMNMAHIEVRLFIAAMVRAFHVQIQDGEQLKDRPYVLSPTLTMKDGLPLQLTPCTQGA